MADGPSRYDVVVVGGRLAGSSLALNLRRHGLSVVVLDRARFPSDTPSTHWFQTEGVGCLARLGVLDCVLASGAPWIERLEGTFEHVSVSADWPTLPGDPGPALCVRRPLLDAALVDAAREAGVEMHTATRVVGTVERDGRVVGVRATEGDGEKVFEAPLVVGADGMHSTVARLVGARRYHVLANQRFGCWGYYEGARWEPPAAAAIHRQGDDLVFGMPADSGLYLAATVPSMVHLAGFRADAEASFTAHVLSAEPFGSILGGAPRVGRLHSMITFPLFFRESAGPGWALVGDAGHFKDPSGAQGISDALRQSERLADAIVAGLGDGDGRGIDRAVADWWQWRDADAFEMHWFAADMGAAGSMPPVIVEALGELTATADGRRQFVDLLNHRLQPSEVLTPKRLLGATARLLRRGDPPRRKVLADTVSGARTQIGRVRLARSPHYEQEPRSQRVSVDQ